LGHATAIEVEIVKSKLFKSGGSLGLLYVAHNQ
jgi:hypothetical protein